MGRKPTRNSNLELVKGTLDMLILRTLLLGPQHGHGIACSIEQSSDSALRVDHGSLYPALQRLQQEGWIKSQWGTSRNARKAKFYSLTPAGRRQLHAESSRWERLTNAIAMIMHPARQE
jgi:PadR family transcriptional regulator, regulatory protein PadR